MERVPVKHFAKRIRVGYVSSQYHDLFCEEISEAYPRYSNNLTLVTRFGGGKADQI